MSTVKFDPTPNLIFSSHLITFELVDIAPPGSNEETPMVTHLQMRIDGVSIDGKRCRAMVNMPFHNAYSVSSDMVNAFAKFLSHTENLR